MHWARILRNVFSNWTSYVVTAAIGFVLAPIIVHSLGNTGYGLWTLIGSMTGYFGLLDLGIRSSVGRFVTRHLALGDHDNVNRTASAAFLILSCGGALAFIATVAIVLSPAGRFGVDPAHASMARMALLIVGLNMSLILPLGVFSSVLIAMERFDVVSGITIVGEFGRAALVVWCLHHGYGLVGLALIALVVTLSEYSAMAIMAKTLHRPLRLSPRGVRREACRELFGFSIYRFMWIVANQLIFYSDSVVIAVVLGAAAITPYAIAGSLIGYGRQIVSLVTDTLSPAAAQMDARNDRAGLQKLMLVGTTIALLITLPLCIGFLFLGRQFIALWMGPKYQSSAVILMVLTIPQFGSMPQYVSGLVLAGMAKHRALAYFALGEGICNAVLSVILARRMGVMGVAWGTVIPHLVCTTIVVPLYTLSVLGMPVGRYLREAWLRPCLSAIPLVALGYAFSRLEATSWWFFLQEAVAMCAVFGAISLFVCLSGSQRGAAAARIGSFFRREAVANET